jgi:hypothetical protein
VVTVVASAGAVGPAVAAGRETGLAATLTGAGRDAPPQLDNAAAATAAMTAAMGALMNMVIPLRVIDQLRWAVMRWSMSVAAM